MDKHKFASMSKGAKGDEIIEQIFPGTIEAKLNNLCPGCYSPIDMNKFTDQISIDEFRISGLCQACQDSVFGEIE